ncbi:MAG: hypothetical protein N2045_13640 [Fimbriimonadales bacterium]|nr:hypothetical protein [Fimbriimonadales bacterium]
MSVLPVESYIAWSAAKDLPTEDVTKPGFARSSATLEVYRPQQVSGELGVTNPVNPGQVRFAGTPLDSQPQNARMVYSLEPIEARWQRARPKRDIVLNSAMTLAQALTQLLTIRKAEFPFLEWDVIPEIRWPNGIIPTIPALQIVVDADDPTRPSVYDEVLGLLEAAPGHTITFTSQNRLRVVAPPFSASAEPSINLSPTLVTLEETGYKRSELVRSVRVISRPYQASDNPIPVAPFISARFNVYNGNTLYMNVPEDSDPATQDLPLKISFYEGFSREFALQVYDDMVLSANTVEIDLALTVYRRVPQPMGPPTQVAGPFIATYNLPLDGNEYIIYATPVNETFGLIRLQPFPLVTILARYEPGGKRIYIKMNGSTTIFGGSSEGLLTLRFQDYHHGYRLNVEATSVALKEGEQTYEGSYLNESGYLDLPDVNVSSAGISDAAMLQQLAQMIAAYRNRVATKYRLTLHQPWSLHPDSLGNRVTIGSKTLVLDSVRERVEHQRDRVLASSQWEAWLYEQVKTGLVTEDTAYWFITENENDFIVTEDS